MCEVPSFASPLNWNYVPTIDRKNLNVWDISLLTLYTNIDQIHELPSELFFLMSIFNLSHFSFIFVSTIFAILQTVFQVSLETCVGWISTLKAFSNSVTNSTKASESSIFSTNKSVWVLIPLHQVSFSTILVILSSI